jgi:hypothetical protein
MDTFFEIFWGEVCFYNNKRVEGKIERSAKND